MKTLAHGAALEGGTEIKVVTGKVPLIDLFRDDPIGYFPGVPYQS